MDSSMAAHLIELAEREGQIRPEDASAFLMSDSLVQMFEMQKVLQKRLYGIDLPGEYPERLPMYFMALISELGEVTEDEQRWKDWKHSFEPVDKAHLLMELADAWHHLTNITLACGFDAADLIAEFESKNAENHARQDRGY